MALVEIAAQSWGVLQDRGGNVRAGLPFTITTLAAGAVTRYTDATGSTPETSTVTNDNGEIPGFIEAATYIVTTGSTVKRVEALSAGGEVFQPGDVRRYGADASGATSSSTEIQASIDAMEAAGGGQVYLPAGTFLIDVRLAMKTNVSLEGAGMGFTILKAAPGTNLNVIEHATAKNHTAFANFTIDGNKANVAGGNGMNFVGLTDFSIRHVEMKNCFNNGLILRACANGSVHSCRVSDSGADAIALTATSSAVTDTLSVSVIGCTITNPGQAGVNLSGSADCTILGNTVRMTPASTATSSGYAGIRLSNSSIRNVIGLNTVDGMPRGIFSTTDSRFNVIGLNFAYNCSLQGIFIEGTANTAPASSLMWTIVALNLVQDCATTATAGSDQGIYLQDVMNAVATMNLVGDTRVTPLHNPPLKVANSAFTSDFVALSGNVLRGVKAGSKAVVSTGANSRVDSNVVNESTTLASAAALDLPAQGVWFNITGTTSITSLTGGWKDRTVTLRFAGVLTVTDGANLKLVGNFVTAVGSTLTLVFDGTDWWEIARANT